MFSSLHTRSASNHFYLAKILLHFSLVSVFNDGTAFSSIMESQVFNSATPPVVIYVMEDFKMKHLLVITKFSKQLFSGPLF